MDQNFIKDLLLLGAVPGIGHNRLRILVDKFGSPGRVLRAPFQQLMETDGIDQKNAERLIDPKNRPLAFVEDQIKLMERYGASIVTIWDESYPVHLKEIHDPPAFLFVRGSFDEADRQSIAMVGTRDMTSYGRSMTESLAKELVTRGVTIVSGLARGVDTQAHRAAIQYGGRTIAVLGCGVDRIYPSENFKLALEVTEHGAVISDYPMQTAPDSVNFPGRNRIISGLSLGTVVVEAGERSGALITADYALEQNRELFAVPGPVHSPMSKGPNRLIKQGAKLVENVDDILCELEGRLATKPQAPLRTPEWTLTSAEETVYNALGSEPTHVDRISKTACLTVSETLSHLLQLELMGAVKQLSGKHFIRA